MCPFAVVFKTSVEDEALHCPAYSAGPMQVQVNYMVSEPAHTSMDASLPERERTFIVVDDHPVIGLAMRHLIESEPGWKLLGVAETPAQGIAMVQRLRPSILILDLVFPAESGLEGLCQFQAAFPWVRTVIYSVRTPEVYGPRCLRAGARAFLRKDAPAATILACLHSVINGGRWVGTAPQSNPANSENNPLNNLSTRELEVLEMMARGLSTKDIARSLCRSAKTIETHRQRLSKKLGVCGTSALIRFAIDHLADIEPR